MEQDYSKLQNSLVTIASELFRFQRVFEKAVSKLEADERGKYILPSFLTSIESEAFVDLPRVKAIRIPATVTSISEDAFDPYVVIIAPTGSYAIDWAQQHGMNYQAE